MSRKLMLVLAATAALAACKRESEAPAPAPEAATPPVAAHAFTADITEGDFSDLVKTLSSDEFEGRGPGSVGEEKTVAYLEAQMKRIGLQPGNNGSYFQDVPMVETTANEAATTLTTATAKGEHALKFGTDFVIGTRTGQTEVKLDASDLVFVGYGVDAPEQKWNDYAGEDWTGKTVVMFVNDPGFHSKDETLFGGNRMTYYGRWTYKFEEAARKGAAAALIVHDTAGASYGWDVVKNSGRPAVRPAGEGRSGEAHPAAGLAERGRREAAVRRCRPRSRRGLRQRRQAWLQAGVAEGQGHGHADQQHHREDLAQRDRRAAGQQQARRSRAVHGALGPPGQTRG